MKLTGNMMELLENWTTDGMMEEMETLEKAEAKWEDWKKLTRKQKDAIWENAGTYGEVLEILDNWTKREVNARKKILTSAMDAAEYWNSLSRDEKDNLWEKAGH